MSYEEDLSGLPEYSDRWKTMQGAPMPTFSECYKVGLVGSFEYDYVKDPLDLKNKLFSIFDNIEIRPKCLVLNPVMNGIPAIGYGIARYCVRMRIVGVSVADKATMNTDTLFIEGDAWGDETYKFVTSIDKLIVAAPDEHAKKIISMLKLTAPEKEIVYVA